MDHQSIGEVLATLRDEFPDITISKIRFLESQGLIDPERTPSGYRKFREGDVARLRWILHQQKDNFLPLKVIKERLDLAGPDGLPEDADEEPAGSEGASSAGGSRAAPAAVTAEALAPADPPAADPPAPKAKKPRARKAPAARTPRTATSPATSPAAPEWEAQSLPLDDGEVDALTASATGVSFTRRELATATGLTDTQIDEAQQYGLIAPAAGSGTKVVYDEAALVVGKLLVEFATHGIGPRHLRMYRVFAEREVGLFDQVIAPRLRRRNPEARSQAREDLVDLARLGRALRLAFLREAAAPLLSE